MEAASNCTHTDSTTTFIENRGLLIPERQAITRDSPSIKPRAIEQWIRNLPLAHETQSAIALTTFINSLNCLAYPLAKRFKAMETLQATIQNLLANMHKNSHSTQWPPTDRIQQQYSVSTSLLQTVSTGYQICVIDLLAQTNNPSRRALATCLQRSQQALGQILLYSYKRYTTAPEKLWYNLHQLYLIARSFNCKDRSVKNINSLSPGYSSVAFEYKKQILLEIATPARLLNSQLTELDLLAEAWAQDLELEVLADNVASMFVIDPLSDTQPVRNTLVDQYKLEPLYAVKLTSLTERLLSILQAGKNGTKITVAGINPSGTLLKLLLSSWLHNKRTFKRTQQQTTLQAAMGLTNSFNFITQNEGSINEEASQTQTLSLMEKADQHSVRFSQKQFNGNIADYVAKVQQNRNQTAALQSEKIHLHHCKVLNVSANGYCLQRNDNDPTKVQIGDIIALHEPDNAHSSHSSIAVVRWLRYKSGSGLSFGIQVLSPKAQALRTSYINGGRNTLLPGLGLPELPALQQTSSLLTSAQRYNVGDKLQINKGHHKINIKLGERIERNQGYDRFKYEILVNNK